MDGAESGREEEESLRLVEAEGQGRVAHERPCARGMNEAERLSYPGRQGLALSVHV